MRTIAQLSTLEEAHLLRSVLAEEGIEAFVLDEGSGGHFLGTSSVFAGFRVQVPDEQAESARPFVEQFTAGVTPSAEASPTTATGAEISRRGVSVKLFQILSLALLVLHFANRELGQGEYLALSPDLRQALEALSKDRNIVSGFSRFALCFDVIYGVGLLGFAALWKWARVCYLFAWIWLMAFIVVAGGDASHGFTAVLWLIECLMGGFLLGVSCCPPVMEALRPRMKQ
jgi:hypothetical protein